MWDKLMRYLNQFDSAVLTGYDPMGYPFSVRCTPQPDVARQVLRVQTPEGTLQPGPAGLLCHSHDEYLWNQRSFVVRGTLERDDQGWLFRPSQVIPGVGLDGLAGFIRFVMDARRTAKNYLAKRGLPRPKIPWADVIAVKKQARLKR